MGATQSKLYEKAAVSIRNKRDPYDVEKILNKMNEETYRKFAENHAEDIYHFCRICYQDIWCWKEGNALRFKKEFSVWWSRKCCSLYPCWEKILSVSDWQGPSLPPNTIDAHILSLREPSEKVKNVSFGGSVLETSLIPNAETLTVERRKQGSSLKDPSLEWDVPLPKLQRLVYNGKVKASMIPNVKYVEGAEIIWDVPLRFLEELYSPHVIDCANIPNIRILMAKGVFYNDNPLRRLEVLKVPVNYLVRSDMIPNAENVTGEVVWTCPLFNLHSLTSWDRPPQGMAPNLQWFNRRGSTSQVVSFF